MSGSKLREQIALAVSATNIYSLTAYSWFGRRSPTLPRKVRKLLTAADLRCYALESLQLHLYTHFYCRGFAAPSVIGPTSQSSPADSAAEDFVRRLSEANCGAGFYVNGWEVLALEKDRVLVRKDGQNLRVAQCDCDPSAGYIKPGNYVSIRFPKEFPVLSPGFYMACSDLELTSTELIRFYWNLRPEGAVRFVNLTTRKINRAGIPFRLKVLNNPQWFTRCDAAVLYVEKSQHGPVLNILEQLYVELADAFRVHVPAFTKPLADGLSVAENPGVPASFGIHRCRLVADGLLRAFERGERSIYLRMRAVEERFAEDGFDLDHPFLNPGSSDVYTFRRPESSFRESVIYVDAARAGRFGDFLSIAAQVGRKLSQDAIWSADRCNWLGAENDGYWLSKASPGITYRTLGPDLYGGTAGIALFLAELYKVTGDRPALQTALGAIRHAVCGAEGVESPNRLGLYSGLVGIALSAARIGVVLERGELLDSAARLLKIFRRENRRLHEFDLISGKAGAIIGLIVLRELLDDISVLELANALGDTLLASVDSSAAGYSWKSNSFPTTANLTGFSHGASGVGFALLELYRLTRRPEFRHGADLAFQYERTLFDSHSGNWPDFREQPSRGGLAKSYCVFWCHGAPGIGLSRLRAYSLLGEPILRDEALAAIRTTSCAIESALSAGTENYSLCHGLTGNAELLLQAARVLGPEMACRDLAVAVADVGIRSYAPSGRWPCGSGSGETPNLMLGLAGIGHFYLRLHDPRVPSILMPLSEDFVEGRSESATRKFTTPILNHPKKEEIHAEVEKFGGDREVGRPQRRCDSTA